MTEKQARQEARRRWKNGEAVLLKGGINKLSFDKPYWVGYRVITYNHGWEAQCLGHRNVRLYCCGQGKSWEEAFAKADSASAK
jgi:hypothetical protein